MRRGALIALAALLLSMGCMGKETSVQQAVPTPELQVVMVLADSPTPRGTAAAAIRAPRSPAASRRDSRSARRRKRQDGSVPRAPRSVP